MATDPPEDRDGATGATGATTVSVAPVAGACYTAEQHGQPPRACSTSKPCPTPKDHFQGRTNSMPTGYDSWSRLGFAHEGSEPWLA